MMNIRYWLVIYFGLFLFFGCASLPVEEERITQQMVEPERSGIYHKVQKGETLWQIAKAYDVSMADVINTNNIPNVAQIELNQLIFIPGVQTLRDIPPPQQEEDNGFSWPVKGELIAYFHQMHGQYINKGIDIRVPEGTLVKASRSGNVVFADELTGYGKTVILSHSGGFHTVYAQNSQLLVQLGDYVPKDTSIARVGHNKNLAYVHFQIRKDAIEDNPLNYLP
ncbi:MAG TPA: LysM peptidoglycan-binding domain-containing M23 family metallopeptidase [Candidatus Omnitrophota bacterium]|nr:LysM peptidoglycan-binding domain-containing M23 family metallopeptidase [Candidatus Omnitrophota bacterium]